MKLSLLADDTTCFLHNEFSGFEVLNSFETFKHCSGLKINLDKTEAIWVGSCRYYKAGILPVKWTSFEFFYTWQMVFYRK